MGVTRRVALTLAALTAIVAGGTASADDRGPSEEPGSARAVVFVATPELPTGDSSAARSRWRELRSESQSILDRVAGRNDLAVETAIPEIGLLSVDLGPGGLPELRRTLAADPRVESVRPDVPVELRFTPNDYALNTPDPRAPNQDLAQWNLLRQGGPSAWDLSKGAGAEVAVIDSGADGAHPDLSPRIVASASFGASSPLIDTIGHGTHVAGLACGQANNGYGIASLGFDCGLFIAKIQIDGPCSNVSSALIAAANRDSDVINLSIGGCDTGIVGALSYAQGRGSVIVVAGDNVPTPTGACGGFFDPHTCIYPEEWAQPNGTGPDASFNRGLVVTSAKYDGTRSSFAESTTRVSVAAYGSTGDAIGGQQGILSTWPAGSVSADNQGGRTAVNGDNRFAYLVGTSLATPQVAGVAALMRAVNPNIANTTVVQLIKATASHCGTYGDGIGWGIIRADEAVLAALGRDIDAPNSRVLSTKKVKKAKKAKKARRTRRRVPAIRLQLESKDERQPRCVNELPVSGVEKVIVFASRNGGIYRQINKAPTGDSLTFRPKRRGRYSFYSIAVDKAGNQEAPPPAEDATRKLRKAKRKLRR
jgi:serine protease